jgi:type IV secretory pathway VirB10-like protein
LEYKKAGKRALVEYCRTCSLPAGDSSDPNHTLKCIRHALNGIPNWKLPRPLVLSVLQKGIQERLTSSPTPSSPTKPPAPTPTPAPTSPKPLAIKPSAKVVPKQNEPAVASIVEEGEEVETPAEEAAPASADEGEMEEGEEAEEEEDEKAEEEEAEEESADEDNTEKKGNAGKTKGLLAKRRALGKTAAPKKKGTTAKGGRIGARGRMVRRGGRSGGKA